ncbi:hypothetical protein [Halomonas sp. KO116]|uniref:hypothetical protein n=1 Tax=Halomonas sp. KO116 TaxID=1504981 RepID=UPI0004E2C771|nr:hypothetical protein [Halomonas sp. KO116]AJY53328.1 hypothetical protein KO116_P200221 [Halomonas sp. KO116]
MVASRQPPWGYMNVYKNDHGKVVMEFGSQREIDALWLLASHIGGSPSTLRSIFSNSASPSKGLYEQLKPFVTKTCAQSGIRHPLAEPRSTSELVGHHQETIEGRITFTRQPAEPTLVAVPDTQTSKDAT